MQFLNNNKLTILLFGVSLAFIAVALKLLEYNFIIGQFKLEVYLGLVSLLFTIIGIWLGFQLFKNRNSKQTELNSDANSDKMEVIVQNYTLNKRESEVLELIVKGYSNKGIGEALFIALPTVKTHVSKLYEKLNVKSRTQAIAKYYDHF